jgi:glycosyltransferase involved in cell wall biosynthesis
MARAVAALGHEVTIHCADHGMTNEEIAAATANSDGSVRTFIHRHLPPAALTRHASLGLWRALKEEIPQADVVHLHSLYMFHDWAVWRLCRSASVPYILRPHGTLDPFLHEHHRWRKALVERTFQNRVTRDATLLHYTSDFERDRARNLNFDRPGVVVPLGIDLAPFQTERPPHLFRARYPQIGDRRVILFMGRLNFKKGLEVLIPAFGSAAALHPDAVLVLAGPDDGYADQTRHLVEKHRIGDRVVFTGTLDRQGVLEALAAAELFALPSHTENFGVAAVEAMAAGVATLLSDQVAIAEEAEQHEACRRLPVNRDLWAVAFDELLSSPQATKALGQRGRVYAQTTFGFSHIAERLVDMYEQAISAQRFQRQMPSLAAVSSE